MTKMPDGRYAVDSFREEGVSYVVDLEGQSCTCPQYVKTGRECKHIVWVRMELKEHGDRCANAQGREKRADLPSDEELRAIFA